MSIAETCDPKQCQGGEWSTQPIYFWTIRHSSQFHLFAHQASIGHHLASMVASEDNAAMPNINPTVEHCS